MANLKQAFEYASKNPESDFAKNLEQLASSGSLDGEAKKYGIDLSPFQQKKTLVDKLVGRAKDLGGELAAVGTLGASTIAPEDIAMAKGDKTQQDMLALQGGLRAAQAPIRAVGAVGGAIGDVIGAGLEATGIDKAIGSVVSPVVQNPNVQKAVDLYKSLPQDTQDVLGAILNTANIPLGGVGASAVKSGVESGVKAAAGAGAKAVKAVTPDASSIMQRVARIPKQKQIKFQNTAGESVGEYLTKRGVYGDEEQIVEQLYKRFTDSKKVADDALEQLPGTFKPQQVADALDMLEEKFTKSSTKGVKDPNLSRVEELIAKYNAEGLTMPEVNEAKRLFEKNAKLDFARENNPDGIRLANNVDNSIREWQFNQAEQLGLKNLPEINRETRLARQLMDDLGAESAGIAGNNAVSLTDWIVLAEGNPASIAAFLGKKAAASKKLQSAVAKKVAGKPTVGQPEAIFTNAKKTTSLPEQKLLPESLPQSTPTTPKSKGIRGMINASEIKKALTPSELSNATIKAQKVNVVPPKDITKMAKGLTQVQRGTIADFLDDTASLDNELKLRKMFGYMGLDENMSKVKLEQTASMLKDENIATKKKVVGSPVTVYHGSPNKFDSFDSTKLGSFEKDFPAKSGFWFSDSKATAASYGKNVKVGDLTLNNPKTIDADGATYGDFRDELRDAIETAKKEGNDGVIIKNMSDRKDWGNYEPATHYIAFDANNSFKTAASKVSTTLEQEAKKYKSAEEFVNGIKKLTNEEKIKITKDLENLHNKRIEDFSKNSVVSDLFHATPHDFSEFKLTQGERAGVLGGNKKVDNLAIFTTDNKELAQHFGKNRAEGAPYKMLELKANIQKPLDIRSGVIPDAELNKLGLKILQEWDGIKRSKIPNNLQYFLVDSKKFVDAAKNKGFDSIHLREVGKPDETTYAVFNPSNLLIKKAFNPIKELTDIWNKANSK